MIKTAVRGLRSDRSEWEAVQKVPKEQLPALTSEERKVAEAQHIPEELYQRSALAGRRTAEKLLKKTEWLAKLLQRDLTARAPRATIKSVVLDVWDGKFEIEMEIDSTVLPPLHIGENIVDDLLDLGSTASERKLSEMLERCLQRVGVS